MARKASTEGGRDTGRASKAFCNLKEEAARVFAANVDPNRAALIRDNANKWANGTVLRYHFLKESGMQGSRAERDIVTAAFQSWKDLGIGLEFNEVDSPSEAEIRIGFLQGDGAWSYIGRYILKIGVHERTMNFGWKLRGQEGLDTALHEIGHTLGFPHEHQNPNAGIVWNEKEVYAELGRPPNNWTPQTTYHNIIRKLDPTRVEGSDWDPRSIMHYPFKEGLIAAPEPWASKGVPDPTGLSAIDVARARNFYPSLNDNNSPELYPFRSEKLELAPREQANFVINPDATRTYEFATFGESDVVMVLFELRQSGPVYVAGDDDSGEDTNARLRVRLEAGKRYILRIRLFYSNSYADSAVMMW